MKIISIFIIMLAGISVYAQDNSTDVKKTKALTVTATKTAHSLDEIPMTVNVITAEDIKNNPKSSVAEIVAEVPGITVEDNGAAGAMKIMIRGESSTRTLVVIDGVKQNEHAPTNGALPIMISPADIERIEIIKGPSSVLYGADALGGVVNIITKKGADKPFGLSQRMVYDSSSGRYDFYLGASGTYKGFFYRGAVNFTESDLRNTPEGKMVGTDYKKTSYSGKVGYAWTDGEISFGTQHNNDEIHGRQGLTNPPKVTDMDFTKHSYDTNLILRNLTDNFVKLSFTAAQQEIIRETSLYDRKTLGYTTTLQTDWVLGDHYLILGGQYNDDDFDNTQNSDNTTTSAGLRDISLFLQDEWEIVEDFTLTAGLRQSWYHSTAESDSKDIDKLVGSLGAVYKITDGLSVRAQYSQGYKVPPIYYTMMGSSIVTPNPDLKPEKSDNFDLGVMVNKGNLQFDTSLFYTEADNYIAMVGTVTPVTYKNMNKAETYGAEMSVSYTIDTFTPYINATYINRTYWYAAGSLVEKTDKTGKSPFSGSAGICWEDNISGYKLSADFKTIWATNAETESSKGVITKNDGWHTHNIQLGLTKGDYFLTIAVNNIADKKYTKAETSANMYESGRHVVLSSGFNF